MDSDPKRDPVRVELLIVPRVGAVVPAAAPGNVPWRVLDADGTEVEFAGAWLREMWASGYSSGTLRSYAYDLLGWLRFLDAVEVDWAAATREEVREWVLWHRVRGNDQRQRTGIDGRPAAGSVNVKTGKSYLSGSYSKSYINHMLSSVSGFYDFAVEAGIGPLRNPVPKARRVLSVGTSSVRVLPKRAPYRQKIPTKTPRALSDELYDEVFSALRNTRDRALIAVAVGAGLRASELLSMQRGRLWADSFTAEVIPKGSHDGDRVVVPIPPPAFVWIARYLAERPPGPPDEPVWMTIQGLRRPLTYWALRQVLESVNRVVGTNVTMHDLRHTFCMRLAGDENMSMTDLQHLMRHVSLSSTQTYLRPRMDDLVAKLQEHWNRPPAPAPIPAAGYDPDDLRILFGGTL